ncbi:adenylate cyclase [Thermococcus guaymasensis DSM 11113]|uniref:Adenylate cyclase n=1 Tax=Thermococcus guaymasensis DSM 11113 TaxID=1432656 RepID=A0A0X1KLS7_9EURY|nr:class IV adenylate cyclase [Thermococcus guaymasensis]AJC72223.1 adenylate cyclase [Thermococcus guaymasensis DSM 11113]
MEIEVKFRVDFEEIERKLKSLGAKLVRVEEQEDLYFSLPSNELLRIRRIRNLGKSFLTYKLIKDPGRNEEFDEIEVEVSSFEKTREILKRLGFREDVLIRKHRLVYKLNDVTFELSNVENIGSFLDIEVISDSPDEAKKKIWALAEKLGLTERDVEPRLYTELIKEKSR